MSTPSTLSTIRTKVRRLTGRPSSQQITDQQIDEYINTFYQYDFPEHLRVFSNTDTFTFLTQPNVDTYDMNSRTPDTPQFNELIVDFDGESRPAVDVFYNLQPPAYITGYESFYSQSREQFFRTYPFLGDITTSLTGNNTPGPYTFTIPNVPVLQFSISIGAIDISNETLEVIDNPEDRSTGSWVISNRTTPVTGSIDYISGQGTITFASSVPLGNEITIISTPYEANRPQAVLFYNNKITLRPVPDKVYPVELNAFLTPAALLSSTDNPLLKQWWQYLAYGAAKKIFEDSQDPEGIEQIIGGLKEQETLVLHRHIVQQTNERTATIYTEMTDFPTGNFGNRF